MSLVAVTKRGRGEGSKSVKPPRKRYDDYIRCSKCSKWIPRTLLSPEQIICPICHKKIKRKPNNANKYTDYKRY